MTKPNPIFVLGMLIFIPIISFSQERKMIGIHAGLNEYFQGTPIVKTKNYYNDTTDNIFRTQNHVGLSYAKISENKKFFEFNIFASQSFHPELFSVFPPPLEKPYILSRIFLNSSITFGSKHKLFKSLDLLWGFGPSFLLGSERYVMAVIPHSYWNELQLIDFIRFDPGLHAKATLTYDMGKRFSLASTLSFSSVLFVMDQRELKRIEFAYGKPIAPTRFDLAFRLGVYYKLKP